MGEHTSPLSARWNDELIAIVMLDTVSDFCRRRKGGGGGEGNTHLLSPPPCTAELGTNYYSNSRYRIKFLYNSVRNKRGEEHTALVHLSPPPPNCTAELGTNCYSNARYCFRFLSETKGGRGGEGNTHLLSPPPLSAVL
jgi:GTPase involved in cell partitioning and DNA repair